MSTSADRQTVTLSNGEQISARLIVLANGLNIGLRHTLGMTRKIISECHSVSIGFDIKPAGRRAFDFSALTYYAEQPSDRDRACSRCSRSARRCAPISLSIATCKIPGCGRCATRRRTRCSRSCRAFESSPALFEVTSFVKIRPIDLYVDPGASAAGNRSGRRCLRDVVPRRRNGRAEGAHRRRAPLQRPYSALARDARHVRSRRSRLSMMTPSRRPATTSRSPRPTSCARSRSMPGCRGARAAGSSSSGNTGRGALRQIGGKLFMRPQNRHRKPVTNGVAGAHPE